MTICPKQAVAYRQMSLLLRRPPGRRPILATFSIFTRASRARWPMLNEANGVVVADSSAQWIGTQPANEALRGRPIFRPKT